MDVAEWDIMYYQVEFLAMMYNTSVKRDMKLNLDYILKGNAIVGNLHCEPWAGARWSAETIILQAFKLGMTARNGECDEIDTGTFISSLCLYCIIVQFMEQSLCT